MWQYANISELYHFGIPGMKWGVRRKSQLTVSRQLKSDKETLGELNKGRHMNVGLTKKRQAMHDEKDKHIMTEHIKKQEKYLQEKDEKKQKKKATNERVSNIKSQASKREKFVYNDATFKKVDTLMQKHGMSQNDATKKAKGQAWANNAIAIAGVVAYSAVAKKLS